MCGLFCYCETPSENSQFLLEKALVNLPLLNNRGPDNSSNKFLQYEKFNLILAHTRLAIQDTSDLYNQPYVNQNSGSHLIYNGEIYDYGISHVFLQFCMYPLVCKNATQVESS